MKRKWAVTATMAIAAAFGLMSASVAQGTTKYFLDFTGDHKWSTDGNWSEGVLECGGSANSSKPVDGDHAVICEGKPCNVDIAGARADSFEVRAGAVLTILASATLEIDSNSSVATLEGLKLSSSGNCKLIISGNLTLSGTGSIYGPSALPLIESGGQQVGITYTLTSSLTIEGAMRIQSGANSRLVFQNYGLVHARLASQTLQFRDLTVYANTGSEFKVSNGVLEFVSSVSATALGGNFTVQGGELRVETNICTTGDLKYTAGFIVVYPNRWFKAGVTCLCTGNRALPQRPGRSPAAAHQRLRSNLTKASMSKLSTRPSPFTSALLMSQSGKVLW